MANKGSGRWGLWIIDSTGERVFVWGCVSPASWHNLGGSVSAKRGRCRCDIGHVACVRGSAVLRAHVRTCAHVRVRVPFSVLGRPEQVFGGRCELCHIAQFGVDLLPRSHYGSVCRSERVTPPNIEPTEP